MASLIGVTAFVTSQAAQQFSSQPISTQPTQAVIDPATGPTPIDQVDAAPAAEVKTTASTDNETRLISTQDTVETAEPAAAAACNRQQQKAAIIIYRQALQSENQRHQNLLDRLASSSLITRFLSPASYELKVDHENDRHNTLLDRILSQYQQALTVAHCSS